MYSILDEVIAGADWATIEAVLDSSGCLKTFPAPIESIKFMLEIPVCLYPECGSDAAESRRIVELLDFERNESGGWYDDEFGYYAKNTISDSRIVRIISLLFHFDRCIESSLPPSKFAHSLFLAYSGILLHEDNGKVAAWTADRVAGGHKAAEPNRKLAAKVVAWSKGFFRSNPTMKIGEAAKTALAYFESLPDQKERFTEDWYKEQLKSSPHTPASASRPGRPRKT